MDQNYFYQGRTYNQEQKREQEGVEALVERVISVDRPYWRHRRRKNFLYRDSGPGGFEGFRRMQSEPSNEEE